MSTREQQWRKRAKALIGMARDLQFKEVADSIRLYALTSVMTPDERRDFDARIKVKMVERRARIAALRASPLDPEKPSPPDALHIGKRADSGAK